MNFVEILLIAAAVVYVMWRRWAGEPGAGVPFAPARSALR
jgi:hypothetical protein